MVPNKLENQIRETLKSREINPSVQAWDRLDAMLTVAEKPKKRFPWLLVAASFVGFMIVGTIVFKSNPKNNDAVANENAVVNSTKLPKVNQQIEETTTAANDSQINFTTQTNNQIVTKTIIAIVQNQNQKESNKNQNRVSIIKNNQNLVAINPKNESKNQELTTALSESQTIQNQTVNVANANEDLEPKMNVATLKVDANSLLSQVDGELRTEYRETVFQKISNKYQVAKTAFVERNIKK